MGKRFLLTLLSLFVFAGTCFAYSNPRWFTMPISVYLPKQAESTYVTNAFKTWQLESKSTVRFLYRNAPHLANLSNITVAYTDYLPDNKAYNVSFTLPQFGSARYTMNNKYFYNADIVIALKGKDGKVLTPKQLNAVALQAVGYAVGIKLNSDKDTVMYKESDFSKNALAPADLQAVHDVYKPVKK